MAAVIRMVDHRGYVHLVPLGGRATVCQDIALRKTGGMQAPWGCRLDDEVGEVIWDSRELPGTQRCPVCYPEGSRDEKTVGLADSDQQRPGGSQDDVAGDGARDRGEPEQ